MSRSGYEAHIAPAGSGNCRIRKRPYGFLTAPYYAILRFRHFLFDRNLRKSVKTGIPSIGIGNITVGGTGKTPHCEMLLGLLPEGKSVAVVSRGYGRKTKGLREVGCDDTASLCGDEPLQIRRKFPDTRVVVCESRRKAVAYLADKANGKVPDLILFDDVMQHRSISPDMMIALIDYNRPVCGDRLLPFGNLRDIPRAMRRADLVIYTKLPETYIPEEGEEKEFRREAFVKEDCPVFYTSLRYGKPQPVFSDVCEPRYAYSGTAICFSAIASDYLFRIQIGCTHRILAAVRFRDHRRFSRGDIRKITALARKHPESMIITTEKDMIRLLDAPVPEIIRKRLFYLPVRAVLQKDEEKFRKLIGSVR